MGGIWGGFWNVGGCCDPEIKGAILSKDMLSNFKLIIATGKAQFCQTLKAGAYLNADSPTIAIGSQVCKKASKGSGNVFFVK
jgi:hypothetical protein